MNPYDNIIANTNGNDRGGAWAVNAARVEEEFNIECWGLVEGGHDYDRLNCSVQMAVFRGELRSRGCPSNLAQSFNFALVFHLFLCERRVMSFNFALGLGRCQLLSEFRDLT